MTLKKEIKCGGIQQIEFGNKELKELNSFNKQQIFRNNKFFYFIYI
jgi:hypothetical protein